LAHALELAREAAARITARFGTALDRAGRLKVARAFERRDLAKVLLRSGFCTSNSNAPTPSPKPKAFASSKAKSSRSQTRAWKWI
jgi:hypothetical protein